MSMFDQLVFDLTFKFDLKRFMCGLSHARSCYVLWWSVCLAVQCNVNATFSWRNHTLWSLWLTMLRQNVS